MTLQVCVACLLVLAMYANSQLVTAPPQYNGEKGFKGQAGFQGLTGDRGQQGSKVSCQIINFYIANKKNTRNIVLDDVQIRY